MEVEHVTAHRSKKEKQQMSLFEHFITECNAKADQVATYGAIMDGGQTGGSVRGVPIRKQFSIVWWKNGKIVTNSNLAKRIIGLLWTRTVKHRSIERSGARQQANTVAEKAANI